MRKMLIGAVWLAVAACGGESPTGEAGTNTTKMTAATPYVDKLKALDEINRGLALRRAIKDSGKACKRVERSAYQEDYKNMSMWAARCSDSGAWAVFIAPNGDVQVRACKEAEQLGLPECRIALD